MTVVINNQVHVLISVRTGHTLMAMQKGCFLNKCDVCVTRLTKYQAIIPSLCWAAIPDFLGDRESGRNWCEGLVGSLTFHGARVW